MSCFASPYDPLYLTIATQLLRPRNANSSLQPAPGKLSEFNTREPQWCIWSQRRIRRQVMSFSDITSVPDFNTLFSRPQRTIPLHSILPSSRLHRQSPWNSINHTAFSEERTVRAGRQKRGYIIGTGTETE
jgi:hypothetical protein